MKKVWSPKLASPLSSSPHIHNGVPSTDPEVRPDRCEGWRLCALNRACSSYDNLSYKMVHPTGRQICSPITLIGYTDWQWTYSGFTQVQIHLKMLYQNVERLFVKIKNPSVVDCNPIIPFSSIIFIFFNLPHCNNIIFYFYMLFIFSFKSSSNNIYFYV